MGLDFRKRLFLDCSDDYVVSLRARRVEYEEGKLAVAGDKADAFHFSGLWSVASG
jgi:hypothetical protein